ncbi:acetate/propionate family kinase [Paraburkholderia sp. Ac-20336]|uniref:acetate/propionate family kinase n=1 Tax=Paraburkholderia sp. Ac-20336 TaxID=2703886 RepID=UPI00198043E2|nr:acetate/propionate family kinase [Paraburkholderia sp. Ac-20336]MBN3806789.1 acetate/propionate family kinase [Paraburkholderia sp. Ac-20336]
MSAALLQDTAGAALLTLNAGSSSIKFALYDVDGLRRRATGLVEAIGGASRFKAKDDGQHQWDASIDAPNHVDALQAIIEWIAREMAGAVISAIGHRVVHGGMLFDRPVLITNEVIAQLRLLVPLAPLHQPHNLAGIDAAREAFGEVPQVACFDTAFHRAHPFLNDCFALPRELFYQGVRRYGFHGLSYEYIADYLRVHYPHHARGRVLVAHLGNGASMCAMRDGRSIASTMGFSALDGLPMGTRCGQVDPGVLLYLMQQGMDAQEISTMLYECSGLLGLSGGVSNDMRVLLASGSPEANEAIAYFVSRIRREVGGLAAALEGLDAIVFTGGIGENAAPIRERVLAGMAWIGVEIDETRNRANERVISSHLSRVLALRVPTDEEGMIARHTLNTARIAPEIAAVSDAAG